MKLMKFLEQIFLKVDDYASLNGLLHEKLRDIPKEGDKIIIG